MFPDRVYFSPACFSLPFVFFFARFSCRLCVLAPVILLADFLTGLPLLWSLPLSLPRPPCHSFFPAACVRTRVRLDVVGSAGRGRCGLLVAPWGRLSRSCGDWGHLNLCVNRASILQRTVMARPCVCFFLVQLGPSSFNLSGSVKEASLPISSAHAFLFQCGRLYSSGRKDGVLARAMQGGDQETRVFRGPAATHVPLCDVGQATELSDVQFSESFG